jgi:hypothetical protein
MNPGLSVDAISLTIALVVCCAISRPAQLTTSPVDWNVIHLADRDSRSFTPRRH